MPAALGNNYAGKAKMWENALKRALARIAEPGNRTVDAGLDKLADQVVKAAMAGDPWALMEIGNRMDGRPKQQVEINAEFRHRDVSAEPLSDGEWERTYGDHLASTAGAAKGSH